MGGREQQVVEALEGRWMMAGQGTTRVASAVLDNRGEAAFTFTGPLRAASVTEKSVAVYGLGKDGKGGTKDDVKLKATVSYAGGVLRVRGAMKKAQAYRVVLSGSLILDAKGKGLDGEFKGEGVKSGNGKAGGNYDVKTAEPAGERYRFTVVTGATTSYVNVDLFSDTPATVANFKHYADEGAWDTTFIHRSTTDAGSGIQVIQGGGYNLNSKGQI